MGEYYQVRFWFNQHESGYVLDVIALDLFLYYVHPLAMDRPIFLEGSEVGRSRSAKCRSSRRTTLCA